MLKMDGQTCLAIVKFVADNNGSKAASSLQAKIEYLERYGEDDRIIVTLFGYPKRNTEFDITWEFPTGRKMVGGLVYHEQSQSWGVHT